MIAGACLEQGKSLVHERHENPESRGVPGFSNGQCVVFVSFVFFVDKKGVKVMGRKILVILGHPRSESLCGALSRAYVEGAAAAGHEVRQLELGALSFDPILRESVRGTQPLEPDLVRAQEVINWAEHHVFVYPTWWRGRPAMIKGFYTRGLLPGLSELYHN